jgi:hypothetical protein
MWEILRCENWFQSARLSLIREIECSGVQNAFKLKVEIRSFCAATNRCFTIAALRQAA